MLSLSDEPIACRHPLGMVNLNHTTRIYFMSHRKIMLHPRRLT